MILSTYDGCVNEKTIMHEFMHAFGVYHYQSRPDRDEYINFYKENVARGMRNFLKQTESSAYRTNYDEKSIMHYRPESFSIGKDTFSSKVS